MTILKKLSEYDKLDSTDEHILNFKGRMLIITDPACTPQWLNVNYNKHCACMKLFRAHGVYLSKKPKQTHCGPHNKAWYSSGAMMSFMLVRVSILFICTLDLWGSVEGVTGMTQWTTV
jgi:hypothetical protein